MTEPKFAWGGVDHDDVGKVAKILNSSEHGELSLVSMSSAYATRSLWSLKI